MRLGLIVPGGCKLGYFYDVRSGALQDVSFPTFMQRISFIVNGS